MEEEVGMTLASLITDMTAFVTGLLGWMNSLIGFVTGNPVLLVFLLISLAGIVIGIVRRWLPGRG